VTARGKDRRDAVGNSPVNLKLLDRGFRSSRITPFSVMPAPGRPPARAGVPGVVPGIHLKWPLFRGWPIAAAPLAIPAPLF
jgi:hypothetical protein